MKRSENSCELKEKFSDAGGELAHPLRCTHSVDSVTDVVKER